MSQTAANASHSRDAGRSPRVQMDLRVFGGIHAGAEVRLPERGILMIGSADDCDLIIGDPGTAPHHCVLTVVGDQVLLRTLEGEVDVEGGGRNTVLEHFRLFHLGEAAFAVGPHWSENWQSLTDAAGTPAGQQPAIAARRRRVLLIAGLLLLTAVLVAFGGWRLMQQPVAKLPDIAQQRGAVRTVLDRLSLPHVQVDNDANGVLVVRGVVDTPEQLATLKRRLHAAGLTAELHVRDAASVAQAVQTVFALHHYMVQVHLLNRRPDIQVLGHFGGVDLETIKKKVYGSEDMQQLDRDTPGLRLALVDYDADDRPAPEPEPGKAIRRLVVDADMAYVVTQDESRYYVGNELPQGGVFIGAYKDGTILMRMADGRIMQLGSATRYRVPEPLDTHADEPVPASAASIPAVATRSLLTAEGSASAARAASVARAQPTRETATDVQ